MRFDKLLVAAVVATVVTTLNPICSNAAQSTRLSNADISMVKAGVKSLLKDPYSAQITNIVSKTNGGLVTICGMINAKNSFGAYAGADLFYLSTFRDKSGKLVIEPLMIFTGDNVDGQKYRECTSMGRF